MGSLTRNYINVVRNYAKENVIIPRNNRIERYECVLMRSSDANDISLDPFSLLTFIDVRVMIVKAHATNVN